jgi:glycerol kinase
VSKYVLAIDAGTTGITLQLFNRGGHVVRSVTSEFKQYYPKPGWVEHDAEEIWQVTLSLIDEIMGAEARDQIAAIGITNQRETTVFWDSETGEPFHNAIVWQCRRTAERCKELQPSAHVFRERTGLILDAYFSGTKASWILENVPEARAAADEGRARFGTIDSWLIYKLSGHKLHVTDPTNASRTLMYDIHERIWHDDLLSILNVPRSCLPEVKGSSEVYGKTCAQLLGAAIPIAAAVGDQQSALFGQCCVEQGSSKNTYGTGCFVLVNAGKEKVKAKTGLLLTLACDAKGDVIYAHEGSVFIAGALIQWLRDELNILDDAAQSESIAAALEDSGGVTIVPAFAGLGAPYWDPDARAAILGLTRGSGRPQIIRAALEAIAFQSRDLIDALGGVNSLHVDGGASANDFLMQFQADLLGCEVVRPDNRETTAQGAAYLAGLATGFWDTFDEIKSFRKIDKVFKPQLSQEERDSQYKHWQEAVVRVRTKVG